jgi:hypothetical protein
LFGLSSWFIWSFVVHLFSYIGVSWLSSSFPSFPTILFMGIFAYTPWFFISHFISSSLPLLPSTGYTVATFTFVYTHFLHCLRAVYYRFAVRTTSSFTPPPVGWDYACRHVRCVYAFCGCGCRAALRFGCRFTEQLHAQFCHAAFTVPAFTTGYALVHLRSGSSFITLPTGSHYHRVSTRHRYARFACGLPAATACGLLLTRWLPFTVYQHVGWLPFCQHFARSRFLYAKHAGSATYHYCCCAAALPGALLTRSSLRLVLRLYCAGSARFAPYAITCYLRLLRVVSCYHIRHAVLFAHAARVRARFIACADKLFAITARLNGGFFITPPRTRFDACTFFLPAAWTVLATPRRAGAQAVWRHFASSRCVCSRFMVRSRAGS